MPPRATEIRRNQWRSQPDGQMLVLEVRYDYPYDYARGVKLRRLKCRWLG